MDLVHPAPATPAWAVESVLDAGRVAIARSGDPIRRRFPVSG